MEIVAVVCGAVLGALLRWKIGKDFNVIGFGFPLGTLIVNCVGGLLAGMGLVYFQSHPNEAWRLFGVVGFLGSLTTFSTFSTESLSLFMHGQWGWAALHMAMHVGGALLATLIGALIMRHLV